MERNTAQDALPKTKNHTFGVNGVWGSLPSAQNTVAYFSIPVHVAMRPLTFTVMN
jgi:hypothetical protein